MRRKKSTKNDSVGTEAIETKSSSLSKVNSVIWQQEQLS
jgi:hypothetical protein